MLTLDPAKVLVVLLVALVVLGPDKLPRAAKQAGAAWNQLRQWRARLEEEVRGTFPDLPSTDRITQAVRSPLSFLDGLADDHQGSTGSTNSAATATNGNGSINGNGNGGASYNGNGTTDGRPIAEVSTGGSGVDATVVATPPGHVDNSTAPSHIDAWRPGDPSMN